ncbi:MAG TPA: efflux RND transporter permease subunit [Stellaceae bacterium]|nr:efflux RND transporter permease subunit [Stellaceae bacterium]
MKPASLSEPFIRRPVATSLLMIGLMLLGLAGYTQLGISSLPIFEFPVIFVSTQLPGASPETMASSVATPLERQLGTIAGITEMTSVNSIGSSTVVIQFDLDRDLEDDARDVQAAINAAAPNLPADLPRRPAYFKANPNWAPVITLALTSTTLPSSRVYDYADTIVAQKLSQLEGVAQVNISGAEASAVRVQVDPAALAGTGLSLEDVRKAIQAATVDSPKGSLDGTDKSWAVAANDQLHDAAGFKPVVVAWRNGAPVRLGDVARVTDSVANNKLAGWWNTEKAVVVSVQKQPQSNMVDVVDRVQAAMPQLRRWLPPGIEVKVTADRTVTIRQAIRDVDRTILLSIFLVVMVIAVFLRRFWATVIPSLTIPVSLCTTFAVMYLCGFTLDNLSLMALMIAVGFVVDDAIVMIENNVRLIEQGVPPMAAAIRGTRHMAFTIISITASLLAALLPLLFAPGMMGRFLREFSVTLSAAIAISAVVSLTLTPMMCARLLSRDTGRRMQGPFARRMEAWTEWLVALYARSLAWILNSMAAKVVMLVFVVFILIPGTIVLYGVVPKGMMPTQDTGVIRGTTDAPPDISFAAMAERQKAVAKVILDDPAVDSLTSSIGVSFWTGGLNNGSLTINLKPIAERGIRVEQVIDRLRPKLATVVGIDTYLSPVQDFSFGGRSGKSRYQYTVQGGHDMAALQHWTEVIRAKLATLPEVTDLATDQDSSGLQTTLSIDRQSAAKLGVSPMAIDQTLYDAFGQRQVATMYDELNQFKVILEVKPQDQEGPEGLDRLYLPGGKAVPVAAVTKQNQTLAPVQINHQGQLPAITIGFNTKADEAVGTAMDAIDKAVADLHLPADITTAFAGDALQAKQSAGEMPVILLTAIVAMYVVLGILYESYAHPFTILSTIPSAGLGALLALMALHMDFNFVALIGIILLIGIVKKNGILMVDFALTAEREHGMNPREAILQAAKLRFRPITMTTLAAVFCALPVALGLGVGSELREPLGVTMIGGLVVSQIVTLYTTPVVFLAIDWLRRKLRRQRPVAARLQPAE